MLRSNDKRTEKGMAAYTLNDEVLRLQIDLERAVTVLNEIMESYFVGHDIHTESGRSCVLYDYAKYGIFVEVVGDYLFKMRRALESLDELAQKWQEAKEHG